MLSHLLPYFSSYFMNIVFLYLKFIFGRRHRNMHMTELAHLGPHQALTVISFPAYLVPALHTKWPARLLWPSSSSSSYPLEESWHMHQVTPSHLLSSLWYNFKSALSLFRFMEGQHQWGIALFEVKLFVPPASPNMVFLTFHQVPSQHSWKPFLSFSLR